MPDTQEVKDLKKEIKLLKKDLEKEKKTKKPKTKRTGPKTEYQKYVSVHFKDIQGSGDDKLTAPETMKIIGGMWSKDHPKT